MGTSDRHPARGLDLGYARVSTPLGVGKSTVGCEIFSRLTARLREPADRAGRPSMGDQVAVDPDPPRRWGQFKRATAGQQGKGS